MKMQIHWFLFSAMLAPFFFTINHVRASDTEPWDTISDFEQNARDAKTIVLRAILTNQAQEGKNEAWENVVTSLNNIIHLHEATDTEAGAQILVINFMKDLYKEMTSDNPTITVTYDIQALISQLDNTTTSGSRCCGSSCNCQNCPCKS